MVRKYTFFWVLLLALLLVPSRAFAWDFLSDGQMWAGDVGSSHCATVHAGEIYDAATYAVGSDPNKISASVRVKLSDPNYGGRFYEYAQTFHKMESWDDYPEWLPAYVGVAQLVSNGLIGDFNIYNSEASSTLYNGAVLDFQRVLAGEDLGGGSGGNVSVYTPFDLTSGRPIFNYSIPSSDYKYYQCVYHNAVVDSDGNVTLTGGQGTFTDIVGVPTYVSSVRLYVSPSVRSYVESLGKEYCFIVDVKGSNETVRAGFICGDDLSISRHVHPNSSDIVRDFVEGSNLRVWWSSYMSAYHDSSGVFVVMPDVVPSAVQSVSYSEPGYYSSFISAPAPPDGDWPEPENPVTPNPPEQPTPTAPTVTPDTDPTEPVVTWPTSPTVVLPTQPTPSTTPSGLDYTGLLTLINDNLISIDDYVQAFNSSFNSFRSDFVTAVDSIVDSIRNIYNYLGHLNDILEVHCKHIRDQIEDSVYNLELYLKDLFEWLPQQLNFDAEFNYDDSYVTMLLRRILNKIPGGSSGTPVTYKPNPQSDEPGFFDWLLDLWHRFLIDLVSVLPDSLGGLVDTFSQLTHYFPFSIPWDVFALLSLFSHDPVTPVFDIPWGYGGGDGEVQLIHIDLSVWDDMMATVRPVFLVGFCIRLALFTKEMLSNFDINKGGV